MAWKAHALLLVKVVRSKADVHNSENCQFPILIYVNCDVSFCNLPNEHLEFLGSSSWDKLLISV